MSNNIKSIFLFSILNIFMFNSCKQSAPEPLPTDVKGDIRFSNYEWNFKNSNSQVGPGPNYFASDSNNIWLDNNGMLHMTIKKINGKWLCTELVSQKTFGYGTYIFTTYSDLTTLNEKAVLGLFSWNDYSFQTQGNSEVDIEFARWNDPTDSLILTYSVQPVWFSNQSPYIERTRKPNMKVSMLKNPCTHVFKWTPTLISWESYQGENYPGTNLIASWSYDNTNQSRQKIEGNRTSNPIVIPAPEDSTHARINLWLLFGQAPSNQSETEVVIKSFQYIPL